MTDTPSAGLRTVSASADAPAAVHRASFGARPSRVTLPRPAILFLAVVVQAVFARTMFLQPKLGLVQAVTLIGAALYAGAKRSPDLLLVLAGYLAATEIAWRQARITAPYQLGPYLMIFIAVLAVVISFPSINGVGRRALLYVGLLLPSSIITLADAPTRARELIAFSLAGPLTIAALVVWLSQVAVSPDLYRRVLWAVAIAGVAPLTIAATNLNDYIGTGEQVSFSDASNFVASGGFGPVQVSSVLGLTVLVCILLVLVEQDVVARLLAGTLAVAAGVQSLLTFSRGGMFATAFAVAGLALAQTSNRQGRRRVIAVIAVVFSLGYFVIVPRLDSFTKGAFAERFTDSKTGRTELASNDLQIFGRHPLFGVGPGMIKYQRLTYEVCQLRSDQCGAEASSHTEFTRMLGEHGAAGLTAIVVLASLAWTAMVRGGRDRFLAVSFIVWAIAQMFYANIRVVAVAFAFGFAFVRVVPDPRDPEPDDQRSVIRPAPARPARPGDAAPGQIHSR